MKWRFWEGQTPRDKEAKSEDGISLDVETNVDGDQTNSSQSEGVSRRDFLKRLGLGAAAVTVGGTALKLGEHFLNPEQGIESFLVSIKEKIEKSELSEAFERAPDDVTLEEQDKLREWFFQAVPDKLQIARMIDHAIEAGKSSDIYELLKKFDAKGFYYGVLEKRGDRRDIRKTADKDTSFHMVRATDYLPKAKDVRKEDIDPRLAASRQYQTEQIDQTTYYQIERSIDESPGWSTDRRKKEFETLIRDEKIRKLLQSDETITLAEAFSLVKAVIKNKEEIHGLSEEQILELLMEERKEFLKRDIINKETRNFVYVHDHDFGDLPQDLAQRLDELTQNSARFTEVTEGKYPFPDQELQHSILPGTSGETVALFNTHGNKDGITIVQKNNRGERVDMSLPQMAEGVLNRVSSSGDKKELGKVILFFDSCESYDMGQNLVDAIRKKYKEMRLEEILGCDFEDITMPTVITAAQEGSIANMDHNFYKAITKELPKGQRINGEYLSRRVQSKMYPHSDMTVFTGKKGKLLEIAQQVDENVGSPRMAT